ncbi:MAG: hypothetical protein WA005_14590, partial [Candidatus Binataceae bacterium]
LSAGADDCAVPLLEAEGAELRGASGPDERAQAMAGRIVAVERDGESLRLSINVGLELRVAVSAAGSAADAIVEGRTVLVRLPKTPA